MAYAAQADIVVASGLYETNVTVIDAEFDGLSREQARSMSESAIGAQTARECFADRPKRVGDTIYGQCTLTRVADRGGIVERDAQCGTAGEDQHRLEIRGTRTTSSYDYRMTAQHAHGRVEMRETGRRIGDCPL